MNELNKDRKVLINKNNIQIVKQENEYLVHFHLENNQLLLNKIINLSFIKIITSLNADFIDDVVFLDSTENTATVFISLKHFYCDLGFPQFYSHIKINLSKEENEDLFFSVETIEDSPPPEILPKHENIELLNISNAQIRCHFETPHNCQIEQKIVVNKEKYVIPEFIERSLTVILYKMFMNVKEFIESNQ
jgi:hypothetical protein